MKHIACIYSTVFIASIFFSELKMQQPPVQQSEKVIFAVISDGKMIEPIIRMVDGKPVQAYGGGENSMELTAFTEMYYKARTSYNIITGGKATGKATVLKNDPSLECTGAMAEIKITSPVQRLKGFEMALATNITPAKTASGVRRAATAIEKTAMDKIAIAEFRKNKAIVKSLKAVKLTVLDVDNDKQNEVVGTYIISPAAGKRGLLFFIAAKNRAGSYEIQYSEYNQVSKEEVMSGEIEAVDTGIYQEMLLDVLDTDNNGVAEIFTMHESFEGAGFYIYQRNGNKWERLADISNYHCGY